MYREKYIKYKNKYLELKNQHGGFDPMTFLNLLLLTGLGYIVINDIQQNKQVVTKMPASAFLYVNEEKLEKKINDFIGKNNLKWEPYIEFLSQLDSKEVIVAMTILENKNKKEYEEIMNSRNEMLKTEEDKLKNLEEALKEKLLHIKGVNILNSDEKVKMGEMVERKERVDSFMKEGSTFVKLLDFFVKCPTKIDYELIRELVKTLYRSDYDRMMKEKREIIDEDNEKNGRKLKDLEQPLIEKFTLDKVEY
jgi:hypothetical protein